MDERAVERQAAKTVEQHFVRTLIEEFVMVNDIIKRDLDADSRG